MRYRTLAFIALILLGLQTQLAMAAWSPPRPLGAATRATSDPSCAEIAQGEVACAVRDTSHQLAVNIFVGGAWSGWTVLAGVITTAPSCVPRGTREVICAARNAKSALVHTVFNGTAWSPIAVAGGAIYSAPSCARLNADKIMCAARNVNGGLSAATYLGATWSNFVAAPALGAFTPPGCASDNNGKAICSTLNNVGVVALSRFDGTLWEVFISEFSETRLANGASTCTSFGLPGKVYCFMRGANSGAYYNRFNGVMWAWFGWSGWISLAGQLTSDIACASPSPGVLTCTAVSLTDNSVYSISYNGTSWSTWAPVGDLAIGNTACARLDATKVLCVTVGVNNRLTSRAGP